MTDLKTRPADSATGSEGPIGSPGVRPVVVYLAGSGRSGSTLLERTLGAMPGFVNVGELIDVFRRVADADERCGCGEPFSTCGFWRQVGDIAYGGWSPEVIEELARLQEQVARQRRIPAVLRQQRTRSASDALVRYRTLHRRLYSAILEVADARVVVDASKWPSQALALCGGDIDLRLVHVTRDVHGVAHSMSKRMGRPQAGPSTRAIAQMDRHGPAETAARWSFTQAETSLVAPYADWHAVLRYEDLVTDPLGSVRQVLDDLRLAHDETATAHIRPDAIDLPASHGLSGNPSRFAHGTVPLQLDLAWTTTMPRTQRLAVTAISAPILLAGKVIGKAGSPPPGTTADVESAEWPEDAQRDWPLVSVVLTTRGRPELVRETLAGIVGQDYPGELEILIVHDQEEPDESLADLGAPDRTIRVLSNTDRTPGLAGARNTGVEMARAAFIATSDDDDVWHPGKLRAQVRLLQEEPDLLAVGSGIRLLFPGRVVEWPGRSRRIAHDVLLRNRVKELHSSTLVMRRETFAKAGLYAENLPHGYAEDYEFLLRVGQAGAIGVVREPLADIRKDNQSWFLQKAENTSQALKFLLELHPELESTRSGHARILGQIAFAESSLGHRKEALSTTAKALSRYPVAPHAYLALVQATTGVDPRKALGLARRFGRGLS